MEKQYKVFVSHATADNEILKYFIDLLYDIGLKEENIFYSSMSEVGVPQQKRIFDHIREVLDYEHIIPIFMLSNNYYDSVICLNEMGAIWMKQCQYHTILLPGFRFEDIKGVIDSQQMAISLDSPPAIVKGSLTELKNNLCTLFQTEISENRWERCRDTFLDQVAEFDQEIRVNLKECRGYCIGHFELDAVTVRKDLPLKKVYATFDFSKTKAELCSLVFFLADINLRRKMLNTRELKFSLRASNNISKLIIEIQMGTPDKKDVQYDIYPDHEWQSYTIELSKFGGSLNKWEHCTELKFLLHETFIDGDIGTIEVKDIVFD